MEARTIVMQRWDAREAFREYRRHVRPDTPEADRALMEAYRQLARGVRLIDLVATMVAAGVGPDMRPRLAICRADSRTVRFSWRGRIAAFRVGWDSLARRAKEIEIAGIPSMHDLSRSHEATAVVPTIPLPLRPRSRLGRYRILWEAKWDAQPKGDPFLLRPIGGGLYAVVAQWDPTPLELAAVSAGAVRES